MAPTQPVMLRVRIIQHAGVDPPRTELARLGVPMSATALNAPTTPVMRSRQCLLAALHHGDQSAGNSAALDSLLREQVIEPLQIGCGAERNRALFLTAVLATDESCSDSLCRTMAAEALCEAITHPTPSSALSVTELHWAFIALSELAATPQGAARLIDAQLLTRLTTLWATR